MSEPSQSQMQAGPNGSHADPAAAARRRKIRKGTQSCWECKRRKTRCSLMLTGGSGICDGCRRRGTECVSQEFEQDPASIKQQLGDRLGRVEEQLVVLLKKGPASNSLQNVRTSRPSHLNDTASFSLAYDPRQTYRTESPDLHSEARGPPVARQQPDRPIEDANLKFLPSVSRGKRLEKLKSALLEAWPSPSDLEAIISAPMGVAAVFNGLICSPYANLMDRPLPKAAELLRLESSDTHPVLVARKLLTLALFLQSFLAHAVEYVRTRLSVDNVEIMTRAFETATRLITSNAELIGTVEGIECVMMECIYLTNAGHLRQAWLAIRRALNAAQMIGIHRGATSRLLRVLEPRTRERTNPEYMWFRIVQTDRYLSLQLGLPQGSVDDGFWQPDQVTDCSGVERIERTIVVACGLTCSRNSRGVHDLAMTRQVDDMLLRASALMPPQWWLVPKFSKLPSDENEILALANRFMTQIAHFHILERLHLPILLDRSMDESFDYNRATAVSASREVLARYLAFRVGMPSDGSYCRGIDFLAFSSSTTICLGHIHAQLIRSQQQAGVGSSKSTALNYLSHQRLSDRGMMEQALSLLQRFSRDAPADPISSRISRGMVHLLAIEADVANGKAYRAESEGGEEDGQDIVINHGAPGTKGLSVYIPHLGTIKIEPDSTTSTLQNPSTAETTWDANDAVGKDVPYPGVAEAKQPYLHSYDPAEPDMQGMQDIGMVDWPLGLQETFSFSEDKDSLQVPSFLSGDDWAMQGVDTAFYDSLFLRPNEDM